MTKHWLLKTEPSTFSIEHLMAAPQQMTSWEGVRNFQARNFIREMQLGDLAFFYHSNCTVAAIVGIVEVISRAYPDPTAFDPASPYFDGKSEFTKPRWFMVDVKLQQKFSTELSLKTLRTNQKLQDMLLLRKGNRLSVMPVSPTHWHEIMGMVSSEL